MADIASGGSASADWILRGDAEGFYAASGQYTGSLVGTNSSPPPPTTLADLDIPFATAPGAIHVWGGSALQMTVVADSQATEGSPYHVTIELTNVTNAGGGSGIDVYNAGVTLDRGSAQLASTNRTSP